ncbi:hypothetical protein NOR_07899 [Metarhizium rileyi]|uniref:Uncharacterized protein n=1 Tax=Metarhizium rileyi (strain RCEF 4871) TaxID=1649241 RepID=A0A166X7X7_METRR|nr:hypothetical protein NOR_07899 [Metarhizium rileyi RCEF 4871]
MGCEEPALGRTGLGRFFRLKSRSLILLPALSRKRVYGIEYQKRIINDLDTATKEDQYGGVDPAGSRRFASWPPKAAYQPPKYVVASTRTRGTFTVNLHFVRSPLTMQTLACRSLLVVGITTPGLVVGKFLSAILGANISAGQAALSRSAKSCT